MRHVFALSVLDWVPQLPGVYCIETRSSRDRYVGSTGNLRKRYLSHLRELIYGIHTNRDLQKVFDMQRTVMFFRILKLCKREECLRLEQKYLDRMGVYTSVHFVNKHNKAGSGHYGNTR